MSVLYAGWDIETIVLCFRERVVDIRALCVAVMESDDASDDARQLADGVLRELEGGDAQC